MNILIQFSRLEQKRFYARLNLSTTVGIIYCPIAYAAGIFIKRLRTDLTPANQSPSKNEARRAFLLTPRARNGRDTLVQFSRGECSVPLKIAAVSAVSVSDTVTRDETNSADATLRGTPRILRVRANIRTISPPYYMHTHACTHAPVCIHI